MRQNRDLGVPATPSGHSPQGLSRDASPAQPSVPNAWTPGPWRAHDHNGPYEFNNPEEWVGWAWVGYGGDPDGRFQGGVAEIDRRKDASEEWKLRAAHDARLIAAAPDLYEALEALMAYDGARGTYHAGKAYDAKRAAERALAKARGDQSCPVCNGDCAGANPPVTNCPMRGEA